MCPAVGAGSPRRGQPRDEGSALPPQCWLRSHGTHPVRGVDVHPTVDEVLHDVGMPSPGGHMEGGAEQLGGGGDGHQRGSAPTPANPTQGQPMPLAQPRAPGLCPAHLVLQVEICPVVLQQLDGIQVTAPAGPVHGSAVQLGAQSHVRAGDTPTLCLFPTPPGPHAWAELAERCLWPPRRWGQHCPAVGTPTQLLLWLHCAWRLRPAWSQGQDPASPGP